MRGQDLDGDAAIQPRVARAIDLAHAAGADRLTDLIRTEAGAKRQRHRCAANCNPPHPKRRIDSPRRNAATVSRFRRHRDQSRWQHSQYPDAQSRGIPGDLRHSRRQARDPLPSFRMSRCPGAISEAVQPWTEAHLRRLRALPRRREAARAHRRRALRDALPERLRHQVILGSLHFLIASWLEDHPIGRVFLSPLDVVMSDFDVVEPDLLYLWNARATETLTELHVRGVPELVVEIASPGTAAETTASSVACTNTLA